MLSFAIACIAIMTIIFGIVHLWTTFKVYKCTKKLDKFIYLDDGSFNPEAAYFTKRIPEWYYDVNGNLQARDTIVLNKDVYFSAISSMVQGEMVYGSGSGSDSSTTFFSD